MCHKVHDDIESNPGAYDLTALFPFLPSQEISLRNTSHRLVRRGFNEVHVDTRTTELFTYLLQKRDISPVMSDLIAWDSIRALANSLRHMERRKFQKILYKKWLTMQQLHLMGKVSEPSCPMCQLHEESFSHVLLCEDVKAQTARSNARDQFVSDMKSAKTPLPLVSLLHNALLSNSFCPTLVRKAQEALPSVNNAIATAVLDQTIIGVDLMLSGLIAKSWIHVFSGLTYNDTDRRRYPSSWMRKFVLALFTYSHTVWRFRCKVLHEKDSITLKKYRADMKAKFNLLLRDPNQLGKFKNLLKRRELFFDLASASNLKSWEKKVNIALAKNKDYRPYLPPPITDFFHPILPSPPVDSSHRRPYRSKYNLRKRRNKARAQAVRATTPITNFIRRIRSKYHMRRFLHPIPNYVDEESSVSSASTISIPPVVKPPRPPKPKRRLPSLPSFITQFFKPSFTDYNK